MNNVHILLIADGRSPTAKRWLQVLLTQGYRVTLVSTYPVTEILPAEQTFILPVAFSSAGREGKAESANGRPRKSIARGFIQQFRPLALRIRYLFGPSTLPRHGQILKRIIADIQPDIVHALRIPYEGMLGKYTPAETPFLVSVWGNDFTLHAGANQNMQTLTREVMARAEGVLADTERDIKLAHFWGLAAEKPTLVVPGGGGISMEEISAAGIAGAAPDSRNPQEPLIVNPRGIRSYAQTDIFFQAIPLVLKHYPRARFVCPAMSGKVEAEKWVSELGIQSSVHLLPEIPQREMWALFHQSDISVSLTTHDGTPNTLLEAMACGCLPVAGDIESLREWITPGVNGLLVELGNPHALAEAILSAIQNPDFRTRAAKENMERIRDKVEINSVRRKVADFYGQFVGEKAT